MNSIKRSKRLHAVGMLVVPAMGTLIAFVRAWSRGVSALEVMLFLFVYALAMAGSSVGYHRYFAHGAFKTTKGIGTLLAICGSMAGQGPIVYWVANHRMHHQFVDNPGDPHSPHFDGDVPLRGMRGFIHGYVGWTWRHPAPNAARYARDLIRNGVAIRWSQRYYLGFALGFVIPTVLGFLVRGLDGAVSGLLWGGFVRLFAGYQMSLLNGYLSHTVGERPYAVRGRSGNSPWLAIPTFGEGWHHNHHAFPTAWSFAFSRAQIDVGAWIIRGLAVTRLAWDLKVPSQEAIAAKQAGEEEAADAT